jgi:ketosteroid isomerase-like protein
MTIGSTEVVRLAFQAFLQNDLPGLREFVDPNLEWTFLDPAQVDPDPDTCFGREHLERAATKWASMGLTTALEELGGSGDKVAVVLHAPGLDRFRARAAEDRNFHLVTVREHRITAIRACRDRTDLVDRAGFDWAL